MAKLGQVFHGTGRSTELHPKWITTWIHYSKLRRNKRQYCDAKDREEIENLADLIYADGAVLQNLLVRKYDADEYEIIAGHKRTLACELLTERGITGYEFLPCVVRNESEAKTRLAIVSSNIRHEKTHYEIMYEMKELEYLFTHYPEEFSDEELRGRMVERIGRRMGKAKSVVNEYLSIAKNLGEKGMDAFEKGELNKDAALALAGLPEEKQEELLSEGVTKSKEIKEYRKEIKCVPDSGTEKKKGQSRCSEGEPKQPEFPVLKNMDQREAFVLSYKTWPVWCKNELTEETYYRYDLPDGSAIVVREFPYSDYWNGTERIGKTLFLIKDTMKHFKNGETNMTDLKEHLKEVQKREYIRE